ncbi:MAG: tetratricopeptide repeat protein [Oceanococcus sp.]
MMRRLIIVIGVMLGLAFAGMASAQTLSELTYKRLAKIHELIGEEEYNEALQRLQKLESSVKRNEYEYAMVLQTYGFIWAQRGDYGKAASYFQKAIDLGSLPDHQVEQMKYSLGQFHVAVEEYREGIQVLNEYLKTAKTAVPPEARILLATAYAQTNQYRKALPPLTQAIRESKDPKESWLQLKLAMHYELKDYKSSANTLLQLVARFPVKKDYWKQLSGMFLELKKNPDALAVLALAERQGLLDANRELLNLTNLFLYLDIPYKAGKTLDEGLRKGIVEGKDDNYELLANAWLGAKEVDKAITALEQASKLTDDGEVVLRLAYLYVEREAWGKVIPTLEKARKLGVKEPGNTALLQGIAATEMGDHEAAIKAFSVAMKYDDTRKQAAAWLQHAQAEQAATASES